MAKQLAGPLPLVSIVAGAAPSGFGNVLHPCGHLRHGRAGLPDHVAPQKGQWKAIESCRNVGIAWEHPWNILGILWE